MLLKACFAMKYSNYLFGELDYILCSAILLSAFFKMLLVAHSLIFWQGVP